jgi:hypothetical protein
MWRKAARNFLVVAKKKNARAAPQFSSAFHTILTSGAYPRSCESWAAGQLGLVVVEFAIPQCANAGRGSLFEMAELQSIISDFDSGFAGRR